MSFPRLRLPSLPLVDGRLVNADQGSKFLLRESSRFTPFLQRQGLSLSFTIVWGVALSPRYLVVARSCEISYNVTARLGPKGGIANAKPYFGSGVPEEKSHNAPVRATG